MEQRPNGDFFIMKTKELYKIDGNVHYQNNPELFNELVRLVTTTGSNYIRLVKKNNELLKYIKENTPLLNDNIHSLKTRIYWILNGLTDFPTCKECGKKEPYMKKNVRNIYGYLECCSIQCSSVNKENLLKKEQTNLKHNGVRYPAQKEEIRKKQEQTKIKKYGNSNNFKKVKETKFLRYGDENYNNFEKAKMTKKELYGDEFFNNTEKTKKTIEKRTDDENQQIRNKIETTMFKRYGSKSFLSSKKFNEIGGYHKSTETLYEKYGSESYFGSDDFILKNYREKAKENMIKKYGDSCYTRTQHYRNRIPEIMNRINTTKRKNKTFNTSEPEKQCYKMLCEKYGSENVKQQYNCDKRYPFLCDFYILEHDLFIEYNGHWSHGHHKFDINDQNDLNKLRKWQEKSTISNYYKRAIEIWTIRDVNKRNTAKQNNLNYLEFFTMKQFNDWISEVNT